MVYFHHLSNILNFLHAFSLLFNFSPFTQGDALCYNISGFQPVKTKNISQHFCMSITPNFLPSYFFIPCLRQAGLFDIPYFFLSFSLFENWAFNIGYSTFHSFPYFLISKKITSTCNIFETCVVKRSEYQILNKLL